MFATSTPQVQKAADFPQRSYIAGNNDTQNRTDCSSFLRLVC